MVVLKHVWDLLDILPIKTLSKSPPLESRYGLVISLMNRCSCMISESRLEKTVQVSASFEGDTCL